MSEDEAKTKWCPFAHLESGNRALGGDYRKSVLCIGSACMAWRWNYNPALRDEYRAKDNMTDDVLLSGFCGLAGKPSPRW